MMQRGIYHCPGTNLPGQHQNRSWRLPAGMLQRADRTARLLSGLSPVRPPVVMTGHCPDVTMSLWDIVLM